MQIDPNIQSTLLGVVSNILTAFLVFSTNKRLRFFVREKTPKRRGKRPALKPILLSAINEVFENADWDGSTKSSEICLFLASPEVEDIVRQIYAGLIVYKRQEGNGFGKIELEFRKLLSLHVELDNHDLEKTSNTLLSALISACDAALKNSIDEGILAAHEARSMFRHQMLTDQLATIQRNLEFLSSQKNLRIKEILSFEKGYRQQVAARHGYIMPPFVDATRKIPIDDIYVSTDLIALLKKKDEDFVVFQCPEFLSSLYRAVLLGNPGGGKSTFTSKLCYDIATGHEKRLVSGRLVTPILVILRDYGRQKKESQWSILEFIERTANSHYQISPPDGAFEYLLLNGRSLVIFDGLDELLDTSYRQEISNDVETFCARYPSVPVLVTSREVGYEQAPLDSKRFEIYRLAPFNDDQVREYVKKWFAIESDLTEEQQKQQTRSFLRESRNVPDLRSNPLLLALMCNIYRGENYIPKNRPEIYQRCATMLYERWDKSRNIHVELPFEEHIKPAMAYLAHWIYSDEALQGGITERKLVDRTADYLIGRRFEDFDEAEKAAEDFIGFCRGRAWVFTDTGTTADGERLYQFTHQTFLEYFAADYLVRTLATSSDLVDTLISKITRREWDIVAQLAFQIHNRRLEGAGDELLQALVEKLNDLEYEARWNVLSFAVRCLEFIVPSPKVTRRVTVEAINLCLKSGSDTYQRSYPGEMDFRIEGRAAEIIGYLLNVTSENRPLVADSLEKSLGDQIYGSDSSLIALAVELGLNLTSGLHYVYYVAHRSGLREGDPGPELRPEMLDYWNNISEKIYEACKTKLLELSPGSFEICTEVFERNDVTLKQFVEWFGIESVFKEAHFRLLPPAHLSIADRLIFTLTRYELSSEDDTSKIDELRNQFREVGQILLTSPTPWIKNLENKEVFRFAWYLFEEGRNSRVSRNTIELDSDALFGFFCIVATIIGAESTNLKQRSFLDEHWIKRLERTSKLGYLFRPIKNILLSHFQQVDPMVIEMELQQCNFTVDQSGFIWRWVKGEEHMVQPPKVEKVSKKRQNKVTH